MSLEPQIENLSLDIEELTKLVDVATRDSVKKLLQEQITRLQKNQATLRQQIEQSKNSSASSSNYDHLTSVSTFCWEQTKEYIKIYIEFGDKPVDASQIKLDVTGNRSFVLVFGHRKFVQSKLHADIDKAASHFKTTKSKIVIYLKKVKESHWTSLQHKENAYAKTVEDNKDEMSDDPQAGLMKMMKKMYDEGDDDMKRTIAKSWYDSQNKKTSLDDPMSGLM